MKTLLKSLCPALLASGLVNTTVLAQTDGAARFEARLVDYNGSSTRHWTVAWVTTASGAFIKTVRIQGPDITDSHWGDHCTVWYNAAAGSAALDGYTTATAQNYTGTNSPVVLTWNCRDASSNLVADGNYRFWIQYAENQSVQGPYTTNGVLWTKGPVGATNNSPNQGTNIINVQVAWTPIATGDTSTSITSSTNPASYGSSVTFTATVSPSAASGTVAFKEGATTLGTGPLSGGTARFTTSALMVGSHGVTAVYGGDASYNGSTSTVLTQTVNKATAAVALANLSQIYDGTAKAVTATTVPAGLTVNITYGGNAAPPTNAGNYPVVATVSDPNYAGSTNRTLVISQASQTITFGSLHTKVLSNAPFALSASASSGLAVSFASSDPSVATIAADTVTLAGVGSTTITASQAGNNNYLGAPAVPQTLTVVGAAPAFTRIRVVGSNVVMQGSGPTNMTYKVMVWTNITESVAQWTPLATNSFDASGSFRFTNAIDTRLKQRFYLLKVP